MPGLVENNDIYWFELEACCEVRGNKKCFMSCGPFHPCDEMMACSLWIKWSRRKMVVGWKEVSHCKAF